MIHEQALLLLDAGSMLLAQAGGADPAGAGAAAPAEVHRSVLDYIREGGILSVILILLSITALGLMITNLIMLRTAALMPPIVLSALERLLRDRNIDGVMQLARDKANDSFITRVMAGGLSKVARSQFGLLELKPALEEAAARELDKLDRPTHGLALLAAIGPMLGLLGTVFGMIGAFGTISHSEGAAKSAKLAEFMSLALVNTAEGLILAIPCTIAYSLFRRRTDRLMSVVADVAERLASQLQAAQAHAQAHAAANARATAPIPVARPVPIAAPMGPAGPAPAGVGAVSGQAGGMPLGAGSPLPTAARPASN